MSRLAAPLLVALLVAGCASDAQTGGFAALGSGGSGSSTSQATSTQSGTTAAAGGATPDPVEKGPPYPIVLAHGFFGFDDFAGLGFLDYYYGVKAELAREGERLVFTPEVDPFNSSAYRGAQLAAEIEAILARTGHAKVILIGHSQGGLDARVVAHDLPERVAAVVTLQTPHHGTPIADVALEVLDDPNLSQVVDLLVQLAGAPLWDEVGNETSLYAPLYDFSEQGIGELNAAYPDADGVYYASIAGRSDMHSGGDACDIASPAFIEIFDDERDPIDSMFAVSEAILDGGLFDPYPNDGLVRAEDARWGDFLGCLPADHLDMIGQLLGDGPGWHNDWDYLDFYVELVSWLRQKGY
jgi:triacylglycerol lipase